MPIECPAWYCARTKPKHEHIAAASIRTHLKLKVFNPRLRVQRATRRGVVRAVEPLFPGYIFIHCVIEEKLNEIQRANERLRGGGLFEAVTITPFTPNPTARTRATCSSRCARPAPPVL